MSRNPDHILENSQVFDFELSEEDFQALVRNPDLSTRDKVGELSVDPTDGQGLSAGRNRLGYLIKKMENIMLFDVATRNWTKAYLRPTVRI